MGVEEIKMDRGALGSVLNLSLGRAFFFISLLGLKLSWAKVRKHGRFI